MIDLYTDPRPDLTEDSKRWTYLFGQIPKLFNVDIGLPVLQRLWTYRSLGTTIQIRSEGIKLIPHHDGSWESQQEFDQCANVDLMPFTKEIKILLRKVLEYEQTS